MILALAVILGLVLGLVRRGRGAVGIAGLPLRGLWLAPAALVLQVPLLRAPFCPADEVAVPQALFLLSHLFLLAFVWLNRQSDGIWFVWLGVLYTVNMEIGLITPPMGLNLFVTKQMFNMETGELIRGVLPFLILLFLFLILLVLVPDLALWLPGLMD